jgi:ribosomal-protein-alanine N-acetyltransferase
MQHLFDRRSAAMPLTCCQNALPDMPDLLVTRRLTLRPVSGDDVDALYALLAQPGVRRHLCDGRVTPRAEVEAMLTASVKLRDTDGARLWALAENARPSTLIGIVGWWPYRHLDFPEASELLFALSEAHWGRGLAVEAGAAMLDYARDRLGWHQAQASTNLGSIAAIRTLWRLDFSEAEIVRSRNGALRIFRRRL